MAMFLSPKHGKLRQLNGNRSAALFLLPAVFILLFVYGFPLVFNLVVSFTDWTGIGWNMNFVGGYQYKDIFATPAIRTVLGNNMKFLVGTLVLQNIFALWLSTWLTDKFRGRNFRKAFFGRFFRRFMPCKQIRLFLFENGDVLF